MSEKTAKINKAKKTEKKESAPKERYFEAVGRRKTSVARVRLFTKKTGIEINGRDLADYFPTRRFQNSASAPLEKMKISDKLGAVIKVSGGGMTGQAGAVCLGIARALLKFNPEFQKRLRRLGYLTRDSRMVERKKYGLKKARRAPQWKKR
ncbi:30S ribosomal protein S9 [Candidatus Wolfebacteria bacterium]|nr:30S ribosomal protein S9 [Candidatus Wolfebacteria bacterium]